MFAIYALFSLLLIQQTCADNLTDSAVYTNWLNESGDKYFRSQQLEGKLMLHWTMDNDNQKIKLAVAADSAKGYLAFGLAREYGGMASADIVALVAPSSTDDQPKLLDMYAFGHAQPVEDDSQDWTLVQAIIDTNEDVIIWEAERAFDTGDDDRDRVFADDVNTEFGSYVIAAWGSSYTGGLSYHGSNRLEGNVRFFGDGSDGSDGSGAASYSIVVVNTMLVGLLAAVGGLAVLNP